MHIEIIDSRASNHADKLIDRFAINVTSFTSTPIVGTYQGIFGYAEMEVSIMLSIVDTAEGNGSNRLRIIAISVFIAVILVIAVMLAIIISLVIFIKRKMRRYKQVINEIGRVKLYSTSEHDEDRLQTGYVLNTSLDLPQSNSNQVELIIICTIYVSNSSVVYMLGITNKSRYTKNSEFIIISTIS